MHRLPIYAHVENSNFQSRNAKDLPAAYRRSRVATTLFETIKYLFYLLVCSK
jgi:hypothetical protein